MSIMGDAPGNVGDVTGLQRELKSRRAYFMNRSVKALPRERQLNGSSIDCPLLGVNNLQHKYVVRIVVRPGALGAGRGQVDIGLEGAADFSFEIAAKIRQGGNHGIQKRQSDGGALRKELVDTGNVKRVAVDCVLIGADLGFRVLESDVRIAAVERGDDTIN